MCPKTWADHTRTVGLLTAGYPDINPVKSHAEPLVPVLTARGKLIRTHGPTFAKAPYGRCRSETAARKAEPLTDSDSRRQRRPAHRHQETRPIKAVSTVQPMRKRGSWPASRLA